MTSLKLEKEANSADNSFENFLCALWFVIFLACANMDNRIPTCPIINSQVVMIKTSPHSLGIFYSPLCSNQGEDLVNSPKCHSPMAIIPFAFIKDSPSPDLNYWFSYRNYKFHYYSAYSPYLYQSLKEPFPFNEPPISPPYNGIIDLRLEEEVKLQAEKVYRLT